MKESPGTAKPALDSQEKLVEEPVLEHALSATAPDDKNNDVEADVSTG